MKKHAHGFTIVELLVVVVVIAILASISIVVYTGIQERTRASVAQSDLSAAKKSLLLFKATAGKYPTSMAEMIAANISATKSVYEVARPGKGNFYYCLNSTTGEFALGARTIKAANAYVITSNGSLESRGGDSVSANVTCNAVGLPSMDDPLAITFQGVETSTDVWREWVK